MLIPPGCALLHWFKKLSIPWSGSRGDPGYFWENCVSLNNWHWFYFSDWFWRQNESTIEEYISSRERITFIYQSILSLCVLQSYGSFVCLQVLAIVFMSSGPSVGTKMRKNNLTCSRNIGLANRNWYVYLTTFQKSRPKYSKGLVLWKFIPVLNVIWIFTFLSIWSVVYCFLSSWLVNWSLLTVWAHTPTDCLSLTTVAWNMVRSANCLALTCIYDD